MPVNTSLNPLQPTAAQLAANKTRLAAEQKNNGGTFGDLVDRVGSLLHLPEIGFSEALSGGNKTVNTNKPVGVDLTGGIYTDAMIPNKVSINPDTRYNNIGNTEELLNNNIINNGNGNSNSGINSAAARAYLSQIYALPDVLQNLLTSNEDQYSSVMSGYKNEMGTAEKNYNQAVESNELNKNTSVQAAQLAAAQGARGLRSTLAAIGALGGTGSLLANRAVAAAANADIGNAKNTFDTNAKSLTSTWEDTQAADEKRRLEAKTALENANIKSRGDVSSQRQSIFSKIAELLGGAGDTAGANTYVAQGIAEQPTITAASRTVAPSYNTNKLLFTPSTLSTYLGGQNDMSVNVAGGSNAPTSSIYTTTKKRDQELV